MRSRTHKTVACCVWLVFLWMTGFTVFAQPGKAYLVKKGRMYVQLPKNISPASLDSFITRYDLADAGLKTFLGKNRADSLLKAGWKIERNNETGIVISKAFEPFVDSNKNIGADVFKQLPNHTTGLNEFAPIFPAVNNGIVFGINRFRNKSSFYQRDSLVRFFLRGFKESRQVMLAGSFNDWKPAQLSMQRTDSGWVYDVRLGPGKWWYKFIADGEWMIDKDNLLSENDGRGNTNSVFFRCNVLFTLPGFPAAKKVFLAGSFNNWKPEALAMKKTATGWALPLYLGQGTHTYKFVVDGAWMADDAARESLPDGHGGFNSVIRLGRPYKFVLKGFDNARQVVVAGSFNGWRDFELPMKKSGGGWELLYTIGPGNYEYKFKVDGKWISDPANATTSSATGNSFLIVEPNYTFRLKGFGEAKTVFLAGDFNNWDPKGYAMKHTGGEWVFPVHLFAGKHLYKFVVDDKWTMDPGNKLWEQNEYGTGNSVIWAEQ